MTDKERIAELEAENERLRFLVAELDFGAGGILSTLRDKKEEIERLTRERDALMLRYFDALDAAQEE